MDPTEPMQPMMPMDRRKPCDREPDLLDALTASMPMSTSMPMPVIRTAPAPREMPQAQTTRDMAAVAPMPAVSEMSEMPEMPPTPSIPAALEMQEMAVSAVWASAVWAPAARASAALPEALRAHVADCAACRETLEVWSYLQAEAQASDRDLVDIPTRHAGLIWWRRRILDEQAAAHRLLQPIAAFEIAAGLLGLIALAALTVSLTRQGFGVATPADAPLMPLVSGLALAAFLPLAWAVRAALALWSRGSSAASAGRR